MIRILIVEDEIIQVRAFQLELQHLGYEICSHAQTGEEAIAIAEREHPDVALVDIRLQGEMDGIETARQIRARFGIPVAFITGFGDPATRKQAQEADPFGYFVKPLKMNLIREAITDVLGNSNCLI